MRKILAVLTIFMAANLVVAGAPENEKFEAMRGVYVEIASYDKRLNLFEVSDPQLPGQGPFWVTPEDLVAAIPTLELKRVKSRPNEIVSRQYNTDKSMRILTMSAYALRLKNATSKGVNKK